MSKPGPLGGMFSHRAQTGGRAFAGKRPKRDDSQLDRFAELLSEHWDEDDVKAGLAKRADPGGKAAYCAIKMGLSPSTGNGLLQRIRRELGDQAR
jgi:hypothetical protein